MQMNSYEKLKGMENQNDVLFKIALGEVLHKGVNNCKEITQEQIDNAKIPMFADDWAKKLVEFMREIAIIEENEYQAIFKYIQIEKIYNTKGFKPKVKKNG
jgi:fructose-specific phosphotransferase system component IIB